VDEAGEALFLARALDLNQADGADVDARLILIISSDDFQFGSFFMRSLIELMMRLSVKNRCSAY